MKNKLLLSSLIGLSVLMLVALIWLAFNFRVQTQRRDAQTSTSADGQVTPQPEAGQQAAFVKHITLAKNVVGEDSQPEGVTEQFGLNDVIHAVVRIEDAPDGSIFKMVWYAEDVGSLAEPNTLVAAYQMVGEGTRNLDFTFTNQSPWPPGRYRAELFVNDVADRVVHFNIQ